MRRSLADRYWDKVIKAEIGCWGWKAATNKDGYGLIGAGGSDGHMLLAHRVSWKIHFGEIPEGQCVLHRCDNPPCTNPDDLFLGTRKDNAVDSWAKGRRHSNFHKLP